MKEKRITQQELYDVFDKHFHTIPNVYQIMIGELFPEPPKVGELIYAYSNNDSNPDGKWGEFLRFEGDTDIVIGSREEGVTYHKKYRRQTPLERGEA